MWAVKEDMFGGFYLGSGVSLASGLRGRGSFITVSNFAEKNYPDFFFCRKAIARRSSSAARPMRTTAALKAPLDPQLASCKREATEQTV